MSCERCNVALAAEDAVRIYGSGDGASTCISCARAWIEINASEPDASLRIFLGTATAQERAEHEHRQAARRAEEERRDAAQAARERAAQERTEAKRAETAADDQLKAERAARAVADRANAIIEFMNNAPGYPVKRAELLGAVGSSRITTAAIKALRDEGKLYVQQGGRHAGFFLPETKAAA